jgi:hypothetical protein
MFEEIKESIYNDICQRGEDFKEKYLTTDMIWKSVSVNDVNIGDKIIAYFYPSSQKYIVDLYPKFGTVNEILLENNDIERINIITPDGGKENLAHFYVSYFGDSRGYDYSIYKLTLY